MQLEEQGPLQQRFQLEHIFIPKSFSHPQVVAEGRLRIPTRRRNGRNE